MAKKLAQEGEKKIKDTSAGFFTCTPSCDQVNPRGKKMTGGRGGREAGADGGKTMQGRAQPLQALQDVSWIQLPRQAARSQIQALVQQSSLPATSPPSQKWHCEHWVMLESPIKSLSGHRIAPQLCFDTPTPRISSNQVEDTSYHVGIKHREQELSSLILSGSYKTHFREYLCIS